jgi:hypothetical protein
MRSGADDCHDERDNDSLIYSSIVHYNIIIGHRSPRRILGATELVLRGIRSVQMIAWKSEFIGGVEGVHHRGAAVCVLTLLVASIIVGCAGGGGAADCRDLRHEAYIACCEKDMQGHYIMSWFSVKWKTDGLKLCRDRREAEALYSLMVG